MQMRIQILIFIGILGIFTLNAQEYNGRVGINTDDPTQTLDINGTLRVGTTEKETSPAYILTTDENNTVVKKVEADYFQKTVNAAFKEPSYVILNVGFKPKSEDRRNDYHLSEDYGNGIRKVLFNKVKYKQGENLYDERTGEFEAPLDGYYKIDLALVLYNNNASTTLNQVRLGVSLPDKTTFNDGKNDGWHSFNQKVRISNSSIPEVITSTTLVYMKAGQKIAAGTRYLDPETFTLDVERLNYLRENVSYMIISYTGNSIETP